MSCPAVAVERAARTVALMNQKGGVGKTTTAVNLGAALAAMDRRVCLIDLDPQAHLTLHLGLDAGGGRPTVYDLLTDPDCTAGDCLIAGVRPRLDVIPSEVDLAAADSELAGRPNRERILRGKLGDALRGHDFVLLDCPPSLGLLTLNALSLAQEVLVPMQAHFLALQGVSKLLETVSLVGASVNPHLRVAGIILCMHERQTSLSREVVADLDAFFEEARGGDRPWRDCSVWRPPVRRNIKLAEAPSFGETIFDYAPWCAGANDYLRLAERVLAGTDAGPREAPVPEVVGAAEGAMLPQQKAVVQPAVSCPGTEAAPRFRGEAEKHVEVTCSP